MHVIIIIARCSARARAIMLFKSSIRLSVRLSFFICPWRTSTVVHILWFFWK